MSPDPCPLVVDLDGTLIRGDSSRQALLRVLVRWPWRGLRVLAWWRRGGRARAKAGLLRWSPCRPERLRWHRDVLAFIDAQRRAGRTLVLATGADRRTAAAVAAHLGGFARVLASDGRGNLIGAAKRDALLRLFGAKGFDYLGDSRADRCVWAVARQALVVGGRDPGVPCVQRFRGVSDAAG